MPRRSVLSELHKPYSRIIIPDDDGRYAGEILEFPGCFSDGDTPEEAYSNLEEAAGNWLESARAQGMPIPTPFASQGYSGTISLRLPKSIHRRASELAHRDGVSLNQFLVSAIAARVGAEDVTSAIADRLDERLDRLQGTEWVSVEGMIRRIPVASTGATQIATEVANWDQETAVLPAGRGPVGQKEVPNG